MQGQTPVQIPESVGFFINLPDMVLLFFYLTAFVYIIYSVILHYHWTQYGTNKAVTWITLASYGLATVPLLLIMAALAFTF
jgi:hypothetical protein